MAAVPAQVETTPTFSNSQNSPGNESIIADVLLDDVFERKDLPETMYVRPNNHTVVSHQKKGDRSRGVLMDIFPHHFPGAFTSQVRNMAALQCGEHHRPLLCKAGNPTHPGPGILEHHWITSTRLNTSGVTRVR
jgi:hypothetical protein